MRLCLFGLSASEATLWIFGWVIFVNSGSDWKELVDQLADSHLVFLGTSKGSTVALPIYCVANVCSPWSADCLQVYDYREL